MDMNTKLFAVAAFTQHLLFAQSDPFTEGSNELTRAGHTIVFFAILIAVAGIGVRVYIASKKRAQRNMQTPWAPPQPVTQYAERSTQYAARITPPGPFDDGVFCPRCGVRNGSNYCVGCGYDLQPLVKQFQGQFTGDRA
jgi:hypothetical protein